MAQKIRNLLENSVPQHLQQHIVNSYDVVGDIAVIIVRDELFAYENVIAETLLNSHPHIKTVAKRSGIYGGEFRILPLTVLAGENRTETEVKESGVRLGLDLSTTYFSVRSGGERLRVAHCVQPKERVLVPFSGVGPYPFVLAKHSEATEILGVEKNEDAHRWALENRSRNKRLKNVRFERCDFHHWLEDNKSLWDRIIMPLPKASESFVQPALSALKDGGWLHYYDMRSIDEFDKAIEELSYKVEAVGRKLLSTQVFSCGHCSPRTFRICIDAQVGS